MGNEPGVQPLRERADQFNKLPREQQWDQIRTGMLRYGPYAIIALLPLFALLVKMVYLGRGRRYPDRPRRYAAHLVFGAHTHAFLFLIVALLVFLPEGLVRTALVVWAMVYLLLAMRAVYGGRWSGIVVAREHHFSGVLGALRHGRRGPRTCRHLDSLSATPNS